MVRIYTGGRRSGSPLSRYLVLARTSLDRRASAFSDTKPLYPASGLLDFIKPLNGGVSVWMERTSRWGEYGPDHVVAMVTLGEFR